MRRFFRARRRPSVRRRSRLEFRFRLPRERPGQGMRLRQSAALWPAGRRAWMGLSVALGPRLLGSELHQVAGDARCVVAGDSIFFEVVAEDRDYAEVFDGVEITDDLTGALERVFGLHLIG